MNLDDYKNNLRQAGMEMFRLCSKQLENAREAFLNNDADLAEEVLHTENRVNALDLKIDRDCERFIALYTPVAADLRFVLALRKINFDLERIGDHTFGISKYVVEVPTSVSDKLLDELRVKEMIDSSFSMFRDIMGAYKDEEEDTGTARKVFKKDKLLNTINMETFSVISQGVKKDPELIDEYLLLFSVIKKLERIGDLVTNIAEEIIFYREAEVIKHRKKKQVKRPKKD